MLSEVNKYGGKLLPVCEYCFPLLQVVIRYNTDVMIFHKRNDVGGFVTQKLDVVTGSGSSRSEAYWLIIGLLHYKIWRRPVTYS